MSKLSSINPATGEVVREYDELTPEQAVRAVDLAHEAYVDWRRTAFAERSARMRKAAAVLRERTDELFHEGRLARVLVTVDA